MFKPTAVAVSLLTLFLSACGGSDDGTVVPVTSSSTTNDTVTTALGFGSLVDFQINTLGGKTELVGEKESILTVNAVDRSDGNSLLTGTDYSVNWSSSCDTASFTIANPQKVASGAAVNKYVGDLTNCIGDNTITVQLVRTASPSTVLNTLTQVITVNNGTTSGPAVAPAVGSGSGSTFAAETLNISPALPDQLAASGSATVTANIVDTTNSANTLLSNRSYGWVATSGCAQLSPAQATFDPAEAIVAQGNISFAYRPSGCVGNDEITVTLYNVNNGQIDKTTALGTAKGSVRVAPQEIGAINFVSMNPASAVIAIDGLGSASLPTQATVVFRVVDKSNNPVAQREVTFELTNQTGGVNLAASKNVTDANGEVSAIVNSGTTQAAVAVKATTKATDGVTDISTNSPTITVSTGAPDQDSFDIAADILNPNAFSRNNTEVQITVVAADQFQNPVADGTTVTFKAESGRIESSCQTTQGSCSVTWSSGGARPGRYAADLERVNETNTGPGQNVNQVALTTILAYTKGDAGFTDSNNNGVYDEGEPFVAYPEAFEDDNNNGVLDRNAAGLPVEFFADFDNDGAYDDAPSPKKYEGLLCSDSARGNGHCGKQMHVRDSVRIIQSEGRVAPRVTLYSISGTVLSNFSGSLNPAGGSFVALVQDSNGNMAANGTTFSVSGDGYKISGDSGTVGNSTGIISGYTFPIPQYYGQLFLVTYVPDGVPKSVEITAVSNDQTYKRLLN